MKFSPKARRFIIEAVHAAPRGVARERLQEWLERSAADEIPPDVAALALEALEGLDRSLDRHLASGALDEDQRSNAANDLGFIRAIEGDLRNECVRARAHP